MKEFFSSEWKLTTVSVLSTLLLVIDRYHSFTLWKGLDRTLLYLCIPLLVIVLVFRESPRDYGFQLGDWRAGVGLSLAALSFILPVLWLLVRQDAAMRVYYAGAPGSSLLVYTFFELFGWEFLFRGWLTFSYVRKFGPQGLWLQAVPFAIAHIGKPELETLSTIFGGFFFGWLAWRTKSFLYPFLIHWAIFTFVVLVAGGYLG